MKKQTRTPNTASLQTQRDAMGKNPMGQHYLAGKIKEVREAIAFLRKTQ